MIDWLLAPIDGTRPHQIDPWIAWHGRMMVLAWGFLSPLGVLVARFCKIMPRQDWPRQLDNRTWWYGHLACQYGAGLATLVAVWLVFTRSDVDAGGWHGNLGRAALAAILLQFLAGWLRGGRGGPGEENARGHHYAMTRRRCAFEYYHKFAGYLLIMLTCVVMTSGLWRVNAPVWMWLVLGLWWALLILAFAILQHRGMAADTYQAIWGPDISHPGNIRRPIGWGVRRHAPPTRPGTERQGRNTSRES